MWTKGLNVKFTISLSSNPTILIMPYTSVRFGNCHGILFLLCTRSSAKPEKLVHLSSHLRSLQKHTCIGHCFFVQNHTNLLVYHPYSFQKHIFPHLFAVVQSFSWGGHRYFAPIWPTPLKFSEYICYCFSMPCP